MSLRIPSTTIIQAIRCSATEALFSRMYFDGRKGGYSSRICAVCDCMARIDNPMDPMPLVTFVKNCKRSDASKKSLFTYFNSRMVNFYTCAHPDLGEFCLSPKTRVFEESSGIEMVDICQQCNEEWTNCRSRKSKMPRLALWNGSLTGGVPDCLKDPNAAEVALISPNRILTNAIVLLCDHHDGIYGWHSMFENNVEMNVSNVQYLIEAGLKGEFVCVLCGPWTQVQLDKVRKYYNVRSERVIEAFEWLKENNVHFKDFEIPDKDNLPSPRIIEHRRSL